MKELSFCNLLIFTIFFLKSMNFMLNFWNMKCQKAICPLALTVRYKPYYVYCNLENEGRKRQLSRDPQGRSQTLVILRLRNTCLSCLSFATHSQPPFIKAMRHPSFLSFHPFPFLVMRARKERKKNYTS